MANCRSKVEHNVRPLCTSLSKASAFSGLPLSASRFASRMRNPSGSGSPADSRNLMCSSRAWIVWVTGVSVSSRRLIPSA
jgi:hypothetical protein